MPMIQPFLLNEIQIAISKTPETDVNVPFEAAADFEGIRVDQISPYLPELTTVSDEDQVGGGTEFAESSRPYTWAQAGITFSSKLNTEFAARATKRFLAGAVVNSSPGAGAFDHDVTMQQRTEHAPQLSTCAIVLGGADFIHSSLAINSITVSQEGNAEPRFSAEMFGSGFHKRISDVQRIQAITITGTPTGGTFTLTFNGQTTAAIAFNANAAAVLAALEALSNIAPGDITTGGGALPGTPVTVTFTTTGAYANAYVPLMTADGALLTGGVTPTVTVTSTVTPLVLPDPPTYHYMHGSALLAVLNNGSVVDLTASGLLNYQIRMTQNLTWRGLPGIDKFIIPGDVNSGAYMGLVYRGTRVVEPSVKLFLDSRIDEYYWLRQNLDITGLKFTSVGQRIGSTAFSHEYELNIPFAKPQRLVSDPDGNHAAKTLTFLPIKDPVSLGNAKFRARNANATLL